MSYFFPFFYSEILWTWQIFGHEWATLKEYMHMGKLSHNTLRLGIKL